jgi:HSP20 family protein
VTPIYPDLSDFALEIRRAFDELDRQMGSRSAGEFVPPVDVYDAAEGLTIIVDLPGVPTDSVRALIKNGVVIVIGEKPAATCESEGAQFHIAERSFGRFARGVRLNGSFDVAGARATFRRGELRIVVPRVEERRGTEILIPIDSAP